MNTWVLTCRPPVLSLRFLIQLYFFYNEVVIAKALLLTVKRSSSEFNSRVDQPSNIYKSLHFHACAYFLVYHF